MDLKKKFEFLKKVEMPSQRQFTICLKEYIKYKGTLIDGGKYGYLVYYNIEDLERADKQTSTQFILKERELLRNALIELKKSGKKIETDADAFIHIWHHTDKIVKTECRLYLRIYPQYIFKLAKSLITECATSNLTTHFKFQPSSRLDTLVLYTDYENVQKFVDIIDGIKQSNPEFFTNSEKIHPLWGKINGYIGFMEEPIINVPLYEGSKLNISKSANTYRAKLLNDMGEVLKNNPSTKVTSGFIANYSQPLDIDHSFYPLNASSVKELKNAGYDVRLIGSEYSRADGIKS